MNRDGAGRSVSNRLLGPTVAKLAISSMSSRGGYWSEWTTGPKQSLVRAMWDRFLPATTRGPLGTNRSSASTSEMLCTPNRKAESSRSRFQPLPCEKSRKCSSISARDSSPSLRPQSPKAPALLDASALNPSYSRRRELLFFFLPIGGKTSTRGGLESRLLQIPIEVDDALADP